MGFERRQKTEPHFFELCCINKIDNHRAHRDHREKTYGFLCLGALGVLGGLLYRFMQQSHFFEALIWL
jgi:hypothetical protein